MAVEQDVLKQSQPASTEVLQKNTEVTPERIPASDVESFYNDEVDPEVTAREETKKRESTEKDTGEALKEFYRDNPNPEFLAPGKVLVGAALDLTEDFYNTGVDIVNAVSNYFGSGDLARNSQVVESFLPQDTLSKTTRSIAKFGIAYASIMNKLGAPNKLKAGTAGFATEFIASDHEGDALLTQLMREIPLSDSIAEYMSADEEDTNAERRLKNAIMGIAEGGLLDMAFKSIKHIKAGRVLRRKTEEADGLRAPKEELPPIPEEGELFDIETIEPADFKFDRSSMDFTGTNRVEVEGEERIINLMTYRDEDFRLMVANAIKNNPERFAKVTVNDEQLIRMAGELNMTPQQVLDWETSNGLVPGSILASHMVAEEVGSSALAMLGKYRRGEVPREVASQYHSVALEVFGKAQDMKSLGGSLLREADVASRLPTGSNLRRYKEATKVFGNDVDQLADVVFKQRTTFREYILAMKNSKYYNDTVKALTQIRYAGLLSSPQTHLRNLYGGMQTTTGRVGESVMAATYNAIFERNPNGVTFGDAYHEAMGMFEGMFDAFKIINGKRKGDLDAQFLGVRADHAKLPDMVEQSVGGGEAEEAVSFISKVGEVLGTSKIGQALQLEDNFMKHINARMTLRREAYKEGYTAKLNGLDDVKVKDVPRR